MSPQAAQTVQYLHSNIIHADIRLIHSSGHPIDISVLHICYKLLRVFGAFSIFSKFSMFLHVLYGFMFYRK